ncbi:MAG: TIGR00270 family protein [Nanoarchaeota archaeon]|jgi:putative transcription factor|nr:TIGR00270 family protein [Nanoarchaeota archaeon]|tara:strand:- start:6344 stop:6817 length:474 start_codon:yes stop_codon:yes gene_type:complete
MSSCELCGKEENLSRVKIEGSVMSVCKECSRFGKRASIPFTPGKEPTLSIDEQKISNKKLQIREEEKIEVVVSDFSEILKREREKRELTQEKLAKKINEKESVIHKLESKHMEPSLKIVKKLESFFGVKLIRKESGEVEKMEKEERRALTLGDLFSK